MICANESDISIIKSLSKVCYLLVFKTLLQNLSFIEKRYFLQGVRYYSLGNFFTFDIFFFKILII